MSHGLTGINATIDKNKQWNPAMGAYTAENRFLEADQKYETQKSANQQANLSEQLLREDMERELRGEEKRLTREQEVSIGTELLRRREKEARFLDFLKTDVPSELSLSRHFTLGADPTLNDKVKAYSKSDAKKMRKEYKEAREKGKTYDLDMTRFKKSAYFETLMKEKVSDCDDKMIKTQRDLYEACRQGRFNDFEKLDPIFRDTLAIEYTRDKMSALLRGDPTNEQIVDKIDQTLGFEGLAHPLLRLGLSLGMRGQANYGPALDAAKCAELDELLNTRIMRNTLISTRTKEEDDDLKTTLGKDYQAAVDREKYSKKFMMKTLLLGHLGVFEKVTGKDENQKREMWDHTVATGFAHCSRVLFTLPSEYGRTTAQEKEDVKRFRESFMGKDKGYDSKKGFVRRGAATHRASAGDSKSKASEWKMPGGWLLHQAGLNVAIGGLGKKGISGRTLLNDGSCGHIYRYYRETGHAGTGHGVMLLGFESDAHKKKNQLGHTHGTGNPEYCSSFGGQRVDEIGNKYGGRTIDASKVDLELAAEMFQAIDRVLDGGDIKQITKLADLLTGKPLLDDEKIKDLLTTLFPEANQGEIMNMWIRFGIARMPDFNSSDDIK